MSPGTDSKRMTLLLSDIDYIRTGDFLRLTYGSRKVFEEYEVHKKHEADIELEVQKLEPRNRHERRRAWAMARKKR
jgi:hypothetical protein